MGIFARDSLRTKIYWVSMNKSIDPATREKARSDALTLKYGKVSEEEKERIRRWWREWFEKNKE